MVEPGEAAQAENRAAHDRSRRFLADAAHQIRTPIAGIQACAETLLRGSCASDADEERLLVGILRETSRVGRLVHDLLRAARADLQIDLDLTRCDLVAICRHEAERVQLLEPTLVVDTLAPGWDGQLPLLDAMAARDIVANLLDNARRHASSRITVAIATGNDTVEVRVVDDGPGLPDEAAETVFDHFVSLDGAGGSGLGLPIALGLARAHGGDIRYTNREFVVSLPLVLDPSAPSRPRPSQAQPDRAGAHLAG